MFTGFFYLLRAHGFRVTLNEWTTLLQALALGLHRCSLTGFYQLCRAVLVHTEADYDKFDAIFLEYFDGVPFEDELPQELLDWLDKREDALRGFREFLVAQGCDRKSVEEIMKAFEERLREQTEEHNGGSYWIGTQGYSNFGHSGHAPQGIRVGGQGRYRRAFEVAGERRFRDFRKDNTLDIRQFQMAFRSLRQYSSRAQGEKTEFDVDETVRATGEKGGMLEVRWRRPRRNTVKVLMLMDSGGSMDYYAGLCSMLFQAAQRDNQFKELHVYYFHNCLTPSLYTDPRLRREHAVSTEWLLKNFDGEYKVILVGDAMMDMYELTQKRWDWRTNEAKYSGRDYLRRFRAQYPHLVWLNPEPPPHYGGYWGESYGVIAKEVDMYPLSVSGLETAMKKLLVSR
ncbi:MAG: VWA domain-containing protein [Oscillospiraceae bacterium]|nr:VWA domain-containing protein [Oscillospiraceae bacterium]